MSSGLSTLGRSASKRVCSFRRIILAARASRPRTKSASIFSRLKFTAGIHGTTLRRLTGVYSFNLFNGRWMLMQMAAMKNGGRRARERVGFHDRSGAKRPNVNEFSNGCVPEASIIRLSAPVIGKQRLLEIISSRYITSLVSSF